MMTKQWIMAAALGLALAAGCKQKEEPPAGAASGSARAAPPAEGSAPRPAEAPPPRPAPKTGAALARAFVDCAALASAGAWDDYGARCLAASFVGHHADDEDVVREQLLPRLQSARVAFPDLSYVPQLVLVSGRAVIAVSLMKGTHDGPLQSASRTIPPTKKKLGVLVYERAAMDDEARLIEQWAYTDPGTLAGQLGLRAGAAPVRPALAQGVPAPVIAVAADDPREQGNLAAVRTVIDALNARDLAGALAGYADTVRISDQAAPADVSGKQALGQELQARWRAFPDGRLEVSGLWAVGDHVALEGTFTGTQTGPLAPQPKADKRIAVHHAEVLRLEGGKIVEEWRFSNSVALAQQLSAAPGAAAKSTAPDPPAAR
ncbi:MAG TPA: ester cyclase [Kofleriaceae bacterium]|nr:ester cyclase [Kofleriaceae bacterium]